ncbi:GatB/YqeY domain-containing protein [Bacillus cereus group sp. TH152-1LC]|uniref:GatB/YqeY domain-containing protein n=1 Tax=Bacillus cereus group sp. TH152-1LC TaxID=3018060 RepID=UPI0022E1A202|nr:GatB/YqeY domain-containing protein [Bacillus cereus group sp. TH152-1LC]MDA1675450.1 GatB/YqeY domain-containing protein [Bacillus cereus group sp. TH152-1LC]
MSKLKEQLMNDLKQAMKEKDTVKKNVIILIRAGISNSEKENKRELTKEEEIAIVRKELKQTKEALQIAEKANRQDIVESEKLKIAVIEVYLPKQLSEEEVHDILIKLNVEKTAKMKDVMQLMQTEVAGRADGSLVSRIVKEYLS